MAAPLKKRTSGLPTGSLADDEAILAANRPQKPLARYGAMEGALARGLLRLSTPQDRDVDRPATECNKLSASEASDPGRHHVGIPGAIISECPGDFIGIRTGRSASGAR
jgi:hypothetical protein